MSDITNPGLVNVCDQSDGLITIDQCETVTFFGQTIPTSNISRGGKYESDSTNPGLVNVVNEVFGKGLPFNISAS